MAPASTTAKSRPTAAPDSMLILFITVVIDLIGFGIIIPIIPFLGLKLGATNLEIGVLIAIYSVTAGLCGPFWGRLSDRVGRKPVILICLGGAALSYALLAVASSFWAILAVRAFGGAMAGNFAVASAMIADITTPENRARGMGVIGAAFGIGLVLGPLLGGLLAGSDVNMLRPGLAAAALSLTAIIAGALMLKESLTPEKRREQAAERAKLGKTSLLKMLKATGNRWLLCQYFLHNSCVSLVSYMFPMTVAAMLGWSPVEVGYVFAAQGFIMALIQSSLIGHAIRRIGEIRLLASGIITLSSGFVLASQASEQWLLISAFFITITGSTFCMPVLNSLTTQRTPAHWRGRMMGTTTSMSAWGRVFGPIAGGGAIAIGGYQTGWIMGAAFGLIYLAWVVNELRKGSADNEHVY